MSLRRVPWYVKIAAKLVLSRIPVSYRVWKRLGLFAHGFMQDPTYAYAVFSKHYAAASAARRLPGAFTALEVGPGDSLVSALVAAAHGASCCWLVDSGAYARSEPEVYRSMAAFLEARGLQVGDLSRARDSGDVMLACNGIYATRGLASLRALETASVDFVWSQAVLEHIRCAEFLDFMRELRRVMRPDGVASHEVDLKDHLGGALNNMRIPSRWWEKDWMASSGFYTNRLRFSQMCHLFAEAGFDVKVTAVRRWEAVPTPPERLAREFAGLDADDLLIHGFDVVLTPSHDPVAV